MTPTKLSEADKAGLVGCLITDQGDHYADGYPRLLAAVQTFMERAVAAERERLERAAVDGGLDQSLFDSGYAKGKAEADESWGRACRFLDEQNRELSRRHVALLMEGLPDDTGRLTSMEREIITMAHESLATNHRVQGSVAVGLIAIIRRLNGEEGS